MKKRKRTALKEGHDYIPQYNKQSIKKFRVKRNTKNNKIVEKPVNLGKNEGNCPYPKEMNIQLHLHKRCNCTTQHNSGLPDAICF